MSFPAFAGGDLDLQLLRACRGIPAIEKVEARFDKEAVVDKTYHEVLVVVTVNGRFPRGNDDVAAGVDLRMRKVVADLLPKKGGLVVFQDPRGKILRTLSF